MPLIDILEKLSVDEWSGDNRFGYKGPQDNRRFGKGMLSFVEDIKKGNSNPSGIVINTREKLSFREERSQGSLGFGYLDIPDYVRFWIIDGRHKLEAYRILSEQDNKYMNFILNILVYDTDDVGFETELSYTLNTSVTQLNKGIQYRNIQNIGVQYGEKYLLDNYGVDYLMIYKATLLTDCLNADTNSPFHNKIKLSNTNIVNKYMIKDIEFVPILKMIVKEYLFFYDIEEICKIYINYWNVIKNLNKECYENFSEYTLFSYQGLYIFSKLFLDINKKIVKNVEEDYKKILYSLNNITEGTSEILFRRPFNVEDWSYLKGEKIYHSRNPQILNYIYHNLKLKLGL